VVNCLPHKAKSLQSRILSGSVVLLAGSGLTTVINLAYNVIIAWFLGPKSFGHATVVYTILIILSAVSLAFQIVSAKVVAQQGSEETKAQVYRVFHHSACGCGLLVALVLFLFRDGITAYLNLPDSVLIALLAIGAAFYIPLGSRRGYIQGRYQFRQLAMNLVLEGLVRLGGSALLVLLGYGVRGVIAANAAALAVAYFAIAPRLPQRSPNPLGFWYAFCEASQALLFFTGQMLINNCDIVLVKHLFSAQEAGLYSAIALVGRVMFSLSSAVVNSTFPLVAGTGKEQRRDPRVISTSLLLVLGIGAVLVLGLWIMPSGMWTSLLGPGFHLAGRYNLSILASLYALKTVVYSLSAVIITFEMSYKIANTSWVQLLFSGVLIAGIDYFHSSLHQVVVVQVLLLLVLLVLVAIPFFVSTIAGAEASLPVLDCQPVRLLRAVTEDEVIAEFLKSDSRRPRLGAFREDLRRIISVPNLDDADENARRRAMLLLRNLSLWSEIPRGTQWYEAEINMQALDYIRVFPRAHWLKLARGNFSVARVADDLRTGRQALPPRVEKKINSIGRQLSREPAGFGSVILLGISERDPLTVLDGNHRLMATMLSSPGSIAQFRVMCGLSPQMTDCCWYNTTVATLFRYGRHLLVQAIFNPKAKLRRYLRKTAPSNRPIGVAAGPLTSLAETTDLRP
jgi:O-antigen/teichoic acid export membrane protein